MNFDPHWILIWFALSNKISKSSPIVKISDSFVGVSSKKSSVMSKTVSWSIDNYSMKEKNSLDENNVWIMCSILNSLWSHFFAVSSPNKRRFQLISLNSSGLDVSVSLINYRNYSWLLINILNSICINYHPIIFNL